MATKDKLVFCDNKGNNLYVTKDGYWYGLNNERKIVNLNNLIIIVERAGFDIDRIEKVNGKIRLVFEEEAVENDLM